jgi:hypothetical protein
MAEAAHDLSHLTPAARRLGGLLARPKTLAIGCLVLFAALGWVYLGLMLAGMEPPHDHFPQESVCNAGTMENCKSDHARPAMRT